MPYLKRKLTSFLKKLVKQFPSVLLSGPRQSGKSTLLEKIFPDYRYVTLDDLQTRELAQKDPELFFDYYQAPLIIDEVQNVPELLSYLKIKIDKNRTKKGQYILTGSQQFSLMADVHESLAGRLGHATLTPLAVEEILSKKKLTWQEYCLRGLYPEPFLDKKVDSKLWYSAYIESLLNKDIRDNLKKEHLGAYDQFIKLIASRTAQELVFTDFAKELGVSSLTIQSWTSLLQRSQIVFLLPPYYKNLGKRIVKTSKVYFIDLGLVSYLTGNSNLEIIQQGPMTGNLFENFIITEIFKYFYNMGIQAPLYHFRDSQGAEVDLVIEYLGKYLLIEIKVTANPKRDHTSGLEKVARLFPNCQAVLVCNKKSKSPLSKNIESIHWTNLFEYISDYFS